MRMRVAGKGNHCRGEETGKKMRGTEYGLRSVGVRMGESDREGGC